MQRRRRTVRRLDYDAVHLFVVRANHVVLRNQFDPSPFYVRHCVSICIGFAGSDALGFAELSWTRSAASGTLASNDLFAVGAGADRFCLRECLVEANGAIDDGLGKIRLEVEDDARFGESLTPLGVAITGFGNSNASTLPATTFAAARKLFARHLGGRAKQ
jgi:hypothetical protein